MDWDHPVQWERTNETFLTHYWPLISLPGHQETWQPSQSGLLLIQPSQVYSLHFSLLAKTEYYWEVSGYHGMEYIPHCRCWHQLHSLAVAPLLLCDLWMKPSTVESCDTVYVQTIGTGNNTVEHDMDSKPCQQWRLQPQPWATDVQPQHDLWERLTVEQCVLPASGGDTETSGAAVNELSQKWDYTFTSREPHILSQEVDIHRSGEESLNCLHISSLSSIVELCSSLGIGRDTIMVDRER